MNLTAEKRIDNDEGYNAKNCRWQTIDQQNASYSKRQRRPNGGSKLEAEGALAAEPIDEPF